MRDAALTQPISAKTELRVVLETLLSGSFERRVRIRSLRTEPSPYATLFPAEIVSLDLDDGSRLSLFAKHLGAEQSDHPDKQCRDREVRIYEELLREPGLPVPRYVGSRWNERTARREVFLEYIEGWNLKYHEVSRWIEAARELGRLHAYYAERRSELLRHDVLLRFDRPMLLEGAQRALSSMKVGYPSLAGRLTDIVTRYESAADLIADQAVTLVHNDCAPKNVLADTSGQYARIFFVDWELAGIGCGLVDLIHLRYGLGAESGNAMYSAYCETVAGTDLLPPPSERPRLVAACELERLLHKLWRSRFWNTPPADVARWVDDAEDLADRL